MVSTDRKQEGRMDLLAKELRLLLESRYLLPSVQTAHLSSKETVEVRHVMVIDSRIRDFQTICFAIQADVQLLVLDGQREGLQDLLNRLVKRQNLQSVSIVTSGVASQVQIGVDTLHSKNIARFAPLLRQLASHLSVQGVLVLFGMQAGQERLHTELLSALRQIMGCHIMISSES
ncbi:MAG: DUF4347 domain-containing protein [Magnetococcales bacterium]|nr:DUF4347 domain-containing protein [Magnetococcales bacterium]